MKCHGKDILKKITPPITKVLLALRVAFDGGPTQNRFVDDFDKSGSTHHLESCLPRDWSKDSSMHRRTATKVRSGRVQRKNRWTRPFNSIGPRGVAIERSRPWPGFVHAVSQDELYSFVNNLADWHQLSRGLDKIILDSGRMGCYGYYSRGTIGLCAFNSDLTVSYAPEEKLRDRDFFERIARDVEYEEDLSGDAPRVTQVTYHLTRAMARAFMLVHVLSHELGHHLDRMGNQRRDCPHGEPFAYRFEWAQAPRFWQTYLKVFGEPR